MPEQHSRGLRVHCLPLRHRAGPTTPASGPGRGFVFEGKPEKGNERNGVVVTHETKVILGVTCVVVQDTVFVDGTLAEATLDWYAQDRQGNACYLGEDSKEYQDGAVTGMIVGVGHHSRPRAQIQCKRNWVSSTR